MKKLIIIVAIVCGFTGLGVADDIQIPGLVNGFEIALRLNPQSKLREYYFERNFNNRYNLIPIIYDTTDKINDACKNEPFDILYTCFVHSSSHKRLVYVKYHTPKDGNTHGIHVVHLNKKTCDGVSHIVSFIPDVGKTKETIKTVYVTNTVFEVNGDITPMSDGKYETIDFKFHK